MEMCGWGGSAIAMDDYGRKAVLKKFGVPGWFWVVAMLEARPQYLHPLVGGKHDDSLHFTESGYDLVRESLITSFI